MATSVEQYAAECAAQGLRGDYSRCRPDFTTEADFAPTPADHRVWNMLAERQSKLTRRLAHHSWLEGIDRLGLAQGVPDFAAVNARLAPATGWTIVAVPGLIPEEPFFDHLANRRFPVTNWLRSEEELDYIVEPDMFHDFFGHVPILTQPRFADFMQMFGEKAKAAIGLGGNEMITRLYWYTAEFGLIREEGRPLKAFGAGLMSSFSELTHAVAGDGVRRMPFDIETVMRTGYEIDKFQRVYFVLPSFDALARALEALDIGALIERHRGEAALDPASLAA